MAKVYYRLCSKADKRLSFGDGYLLDGERQKQTANRAVSQNAPGTLFNKNPGCHKSMRPLTLSHSSALVNRTGYNGFPASNRLRHSLQHPRVQTQDQLTQSELSNCLAEIIDLVKPPSHIFGTLVCKYMVQKQLGRAQAPLVKLEKAAGQRFACQMQSRG